MFYNDLKFKYKPPWLTDLLQRQMIQGLWRPGEQPLKNSFTAHAQSWQLSNFLSHSFKQKKKTWRAGEAFIFILKPVVPLTQPYWKSGVSDTTLRTHYCHSFSWFPWHESTRSTATPT